MLNSLSVSEILPILGTLKLITLLRSILNQTKAFHARLHYAPMIPTLTAIAHINLLAPELFF